VSTPKRESQSGQDGVHGYTEQPQPGQIKLKLRDWGGNKVATIGNLTNSNVVILAGQRQDDRRLEYVVVRAAGSPRWLMAVSKEPSNRAPSPRTDRRTDRRIYRSNL